jgi:putative phage-type endonuclease
MKHTVLDRLLRKFSGELYKPVKNGGSGELRISKKGIQTILEQYKLASPYPITKKLVVDRIEQIEGYKKQLEEVHKVPFIKQRTEPWYKIREGMITASNFGTVCGRNKNGTTKSYLKKQCGFEPTKEFDEKILKIMDFGTLYEEVAIKFYEDRFSVKINEFGLIPYEKSKQPDGTYKFGASPDGISDDGIMIEIKCPPLRDITGMIPIAYYYQVQGQMEICDLDECDFCEFAFAEYRSLDEFFDDYDETGYYSQNIEDKGIIIEYMPLSEEMGDGDGEGDGKKIEKKKPLPLYSDIGLSGDELLIWYKSEIKKLKKHGITDNNIFTRSWRLEKTNIIRIYRDPQFVRDMFDELSYVSKELSKLQKDREIYNKRMEDKPSTFNKRQWGKDETEYIKIGDSNQFDYLKSKIKHRLSNEAYQDKITGTRKKSFKDTKERMKEKEKEKKLKNYIECDDSDNDSESGYVKMPGTKMKRID